MEVFQLEVLQDELQVEVVHLEVLQLEEVLEEELRVGWGLGEGKATVEETGAEVLIARGPFDNLQVTRSELEHPLHDLHGLTQGP